MSISFPASRPSLTCRWDRYAEYRLSEIPGVDHIPAHWDVKRLKRVAAIRPSNVDKKTVAGQEAVGLCNYLDVYKNDYITDELDFMQATATASQIQTFQLRAGDVVITKDSESWDDIAVPAFVPKHLEGVLCGYHLALIRPDPTLAEGEFLFRCFSAEGLRDQFRIAANGITRFGLDTSSINDALFPLPPLKEQIKIASFLDCETAKIDALIAKKQQLIELLKEKRQAVISHAVTKGVNPRIPTKPSGIEWLGDVPEHWSVAPVNSRYSVQLGKMLDTTKITGEHLRPYLRVFDVQWGSINTADLPEMDFDDECRKKFRLVPGDLLINEGGSYPGRSAIWVGQIEECYYQKAIHRLRPRRFEEDNSKFCFYLMCWATNYGVFVAGGNESTIEHLPAEKLRRYRFAFPPMTEQRSIVGYLDQQTSKLDALNVAVQRAIDLLQERRTALISAAVTGKIDVRGEAE
jgi:type I restriction enzyme, S subunit